MKLQDLFKVDFSTIEKEYDRKFPTIDGYLYYKAVLVIYLLGILFRQKKKHQCI